MKNQNSNQPADINMTVCDRNANVLPMLQTYTTKVLKPNIIGRRNILTQQMMDCEGYKYVIRWDFDLNGKTVTVPANCIIEFDGGSLKNGTVIGQDTLFINVGDVEIWGEDLTTEGTWEERNAVVQSDWNQTDTEAKDFIKNKPDIYTKTESDQKFAPASDTQRIESLERAVGSGGSVDSRIAAAKTEIIGGATPRGNTLKKVEDRLSPVETAVGSGGSIDTRIAIAVGAEQTRAEAAENALQAGINAEATARAAAVSSETERARTAEENLRQLYEALSQSQPVPVTSLPATGEAGKIYRLAGVSSYADYMYDENNLTTPIKMAEYSNAIDDELTEGSGNLVKNGTVYDAVRSLSKCIFEKTDIITGKYINTSGVISNAGADYKLVKFNLSDPGTYCVYSKNAGSSNAVLARYTDSDYTILDRIILPINSCNTQVSLTLSAGYYAFCFTDADAFVCKDISSKNYSFSGTDLPVLDVLNSTYITSNGLAVGGNLYYVAKLLLEAGDYEIKCTQSSYSHMLVKFTDASFSTVESVIIPSDIDNTDCNVVITLAAGYYAFGFNRASSLNYASIKKALKTDADNLVNRMNTVYGKYINLSGEIATASDEYGVSRLSLAAGVYRLDFRGQEYSGLALVKYTDNTYSTVDRIYQQNKANGSQIVWLPAGYYAMTVNKADSRIGVYRESDIFYFPCHHSNIPEKDICHYMYIAYDGTIRGVNEDYRTVMKHLPEGLYDIRIPNDGTTSCAFIVKYTDDTYKTVESVIRGADSVVSVNETMYLEDGYYGFCFPSSGDNYADFGISVHAYDNDRDKKYGTFDLGERNLVINVPYQSVSYQGDCVFGISDVEKAKGMYQCPYIATCSNDYRIAKFTIQKGGRYLVVSPGSGSCMTLAKFCNPACTRIDTAVLGIIGSEFAKVVYLEAGYYAFGWCYNENDPVEGEAYITSVIPATLWSSISDGKYINTANVSVDTMLVSKFPTYADDFTLSAVIKPLSFDNGRFECLVGKYEKPNNASTMVCLGKDGEGTYLALSTIDSDTLQVLNVHKNYIDGLDLRTDTEYIVNLEQRHDTYRYHNIRLVTNRGEMFEYNKVEDSFSTTVGSGWGVIAVLPAYGTAQVSDLSFGYPADTDNIRLICFGDSLVEGLNSTAARLDLRIADMIGDKIGKDRCLNLGKGGEAVSGLVTYLKSHLSLYSQAKYVLFCIGHNDKDTANVAKTLKDINEWTAKYGIKPIWLTVTPFRDGTVKSTLNAQIRQFENVVDVATIFYNDDDTINTSLYGDAVHPSVAGYRRIYNMIISKCSYLLD